MPFIRLMPFAFLGLCTNFCVRILLFIKTIQESSLSFYEAFQIFLCGFWFDAIATLLALTPIALYTFLLPRRLQRSVIDQRIDFIFRTVFCFILLFTAVAEYLFWDEFTSRFNFIAVDYLIYTNEVIGNIIESYPVYPLLTGVLALSVFGAWVSRLLFPFPVLKYDADLLNNTRFSFKKRLATFITFLTITLGLLWVSDIEQSTIQGNSTASQLARNGTYSLFDAFWHNEINYEKFYKTEAEDVVIARIHHLLRNESEPFIHSETDRDIIRQITPAGEEKHKNVVIVGMESMSASYMKAFGDTRNLTPYLDQVANQGLFLTNAFATGTRTVRGLEALSLSVPPTPGQSILRRPENEDLASLGFIFQDRGYDTRFLYGGYGYFDNMNYFFSKNGFGITDRTDLKPEEVNFSNIWGVSDGDMFSHLISMADQSYSKNIPFAYLMMTTSNHRPFTYPDGKIDIPSGKGRAGGIKYADYAIGQFIEQAKTKPWFKDTIFVFVADHTAGAGGKQDFDPVRYHIPVIFYAPDMITPQKVDTLVSQIDVAPTLLGVMNMKYNSKFYGQNVLKSSYTPRAFVSTYQKVGLVYDGVITVLSPKQGIEQYTWPKMENLPEQDYNQKAIQNTIAYYQSASWWKQNQKKVETIVKEQPKDVAPQSNLPSLMREISAPQPEITTGDTPIK